MKIFSVLQLDNGEQLRIGDKVKVKGQNASSIEATIHGLNGNEFIKDYIGAITFFTPEYNVFILKIDEIEKIELIKQKHLGVK